MIIRADGIAVISEQSISRTYPYTAKPILSQRLDLLMGQALTTAYMTECKRACRAPYGGARQAYHQ